MQGSDQKSVLLQCFYDASAPPEVTALFVDKLQCESLSDFYLIVNEKTWEDEIYTHFESNEATNTVATKPIIFARTKAAWIAARKAVKGMLESASSDSPEDFETPLPDPTKEQLDKNWKALNYPSFSIYLTPADSLKGRCYREMAKIVPTIIPVERAKALVHAATPADLQKVRLGQIVLTIGEENLNIEVDTPVSYYFGLRVIAHAMIYAGSGKVKSHKQPGQMVTMSPFDVNLGYCDESLRYANSFPARAAYRLAWFKERDVETRGTMVQYMRQGWPQGEALTQAFVDHKAEWREKPAEERQTQSITEDQRAAKRLKSADSEQCQKSQTHILTGTHFDSTPVCKPHNDPRGCSAKESDCPKHHRHVCDALKPDGKTICGATNHTRAKHHNPVHG